MAIQFFKSLKKSVKHWYIPLIIGIIFIATGIWTFSSKDESYLALTVIFSLTFLISGILDIFFAISNRKELENWGWTLVLGIISALIGVMLLKNPLVSIVSLPLYVGFMIMFRSFSAIGTAMDLKDYGVMEWGTLMTFGILGVLFSFILIWYPIFAGMTIVFWTGLALLTIGVFNIYLAFKMKKLHKNWDGISTEVRSKFEEIKNEILDETQNY